MSIFKNVQTIEQTKIVSREDAVVYYVIVRVFYLIRKLKQSVLGCARQDTVATENGYVQFARIKKHSTCSFSFVLDNC